MATLNTAELTGTDNRSGESRVTDVVRIDRSKFFLGDIAPIERNPRSGKLEATKPSEYITIPAEIRQEYADTLRNVLNRLLDIGQSADPATRDILSRNHPVEDRLLHELTTTNEGGTAEVDEKKISRYLETADGLMHTTMLIEQQMTMKMYALAQVAIGLPAGDRIRIANEMDVLWGRHQSALNRLGRAMPRFPWGPVTAVAGAAAVGFGFLKIFESGNDAAKYGVAASAAVAAFALPFAAREGVRGVQWAIRSGDRTQLRYCQDAFRVIREDPNQARYVKAMYGIDVNDTAYGAHGPEITRNPPNTNRVPESVTSAKKLQGEIFRQLKMRRDFYGALGVGEDTIDATPEQFIYRYLQGEQEQTGTRMQQLLIDKFRPNTDGIVDMAGRHPNDVVFMTTPPPGGNELDITQTLKNFNKARTEVMLEFSQQSMRREAARKNGIEGPKKIADKIKEIDSPEAKARRDADYDRQIREQEAEKAYIQPDKDKLDAYKTKRDELQAARTAAINEAGVSSVIELDDLISTIRNQIENPTAGSGSIFARREVAIGLRRTALDTEIAAATNRAINPPGLPPLTGTTAARASAAAQADTEQSVNGRFQPQLDALDREKAALQARLTTLEQKRNDIVTKRDAIGDNSQEGINTRGVFDSLHTDYESLRLQMEHVNSFADYIRHVEALAPGTIPPDVLGRLPHFNTPPAVDIRALPTNEIMRRINVANEILHEDTSTWAWVVPGNLNWWPAIQNGDRGTLLQHARIEAKALDQEPDRDPITGNLTGVRAVIGTNINELNALQVSRNQLRTFTPDEIYGKIQVVVDANPGRFTGWTIGNRASNIALIERAINDDRNNYYSIRVGQIDRYLQDRTDEIGRLTLRKTDTGAVEAQKTRLTIVKELMDNQKEFLNGSKLRVFLDDENRDRFTDINPVPVNPADPDYARYSDEERAGTPPFPRGYYEILNVLFDYRDKDRDTRLRQIKELLSPTRFAEILNESFHLGVLGTPTLSTALNNFYIRINANLLTTSQLKQFSINLTNILRDETLARTL